MVVVPKVSSRKTRRRGSMPAAKTFQTGAVGDDVGPVPLGGVDRLFLRLIFSCLEGDTRGWRWRCPASGRV